MVLFVAVIGRYRARLPRSIPLKQGLGTTIAPGPILVGNLLPAERAKQLLLGKASDDIAQKHPATKFTCATGRGGQWELSHQGETDMTSAVVTNVDEIPELTVDQLDEAAGGIIPIICVFGVYACVGFALGMTLFGP